MNDFWLTRAQLITPSGVRDGAMRIARGRIAAIRSKAPRAAQAINLRGAYLAPGFIDLHVWGSPETVSRAAAKDGTTAFLSALGPDAPGALLQRLSTLHVTRFTFNGARCMGAHLEGPFLNPRRAGALPKRWMRRPMPAELRAIARVGSGRLMTVAPELPGAVEAIRWLRRHGLVVSLGHSEASARDALRAVEAGASAVTHVFNGMPPFHHRQPGLVDEALTNPRLTTMAILDGVHSSPEAFRLLLRAKGPERIALVTDSIAHEHPHAQRRGGAFYARRGVLAGSALTMIGAVRNAVRFGGVSLADAVRMATEIPARLLGMERMMGALALGRRADLTAFDHHFRVLMTVVGGRVVYERNR